MQRICDLSRASPRRRGLARDRSGNVSLETALLAAPLFGFVLTLINAGHVMWLQNALDISVTDAARCASANENVSSATRCRNGDEIKAYAVGRSGAGFDSTVFSFAQDSCGNRVSASYPVSLTLPFASYSLTLTAQACYPRLSSI